MGIFRSRDTARFADLPDLAPVDEPTVELSPLDGRDRARLLRLVHRTLLAEALKPDVLRDGAVTDLCLDVRQVLLPAPPLPDDYPARPLRPSVPVIPGRST